MIYKKDTTYGGVACCACIAAYDLATHGAAPADTTHVIEYTRLSDSVREHIDFFQGEPTDIDVIKS